MSGFFGDPSGPQPPRILRAPLEQLGIFNQLAQQNIPLTLIFQGQGQRFLTYISDTAREQGKLALDELVPAEGQRFLVRGDAFRVDAHLDGVHIYWKSHAAPEMGLVGGHTAAWFNLPDELYYHQKRSAFRAPTLPGEPISILLSGHASTPTLEAKILDLSATGCRVRIEQQETGLNAGDALPSSTLVLPDGRLPLVAEVRHCKTHDSLPYSIAGLRFINLDGMAQRTIDRYVNQLQREARRRQEGDLF